jgi:hypothetical protein
MTGKDRSTVSAPIHLSVYPCRLQRWWPLLLVWIVGMVVIPTTIVGQHRIQLMGTAGYEFTRAYAPVYDLTLLFYQRWGARLTRIPSFPLLDDHSVQLNDSTLSTGQIRGDLTLPFILRTVDYHSHSGAKNTPLDFATAYVGIGYQHLMGTYYQRSYTVVAERLESAENQYEIEIPVSALTVGMSFGESILVIDFYLLYLRGSVGPTDFLNRTIGFEHWLLTTAIGLSF